MRTFRARHALAFAAVILAGTPAPAHAGLLSWLDQLSGPGPFAVFDGSLGVKCSRPPSQRAGEVTSASGISAGCQSKVTLAKRNLTWFVSGGAGLEIKKNHLQYDHAGAHRVRLLRAGTSLDYTVFSTLDIGTGAGVMYFAGPEFSNFARPYIEPVRIGIRPLAKWKGTVHERRGALLLYANWNILLGSVEGKDFGAPSDSFHARHELKRHECGLTLDVGRLLYWKGHRPASSPPAIKGGTGRSTPQQ
jgi:hypothetical protein